MAAAVISQFLVGFGTYPLVRIGIALISDITKPELSKRFIITLQSGYIMGAIIISSAYGWLRHWRYVTLYFIFLPYLLVLICMAIFLQDTPRYLLRKCSVAEIKQSLNFIARVNGKPDEFLNEEEIDVFRK